ncbi:hypothetical protein Zmor_008846 [Zophobas morio]|uniref:Uncharacterized protein n=1 Tax=Zophobas morio TaxID=2755281 RepID=A0AA38HK57_9CUCU|nr:hypothetical protein Zmor_008846 [Zophobas morio]
MIFLRWKPKWFSGMVQDTQVTDGRDTYTVLFEKRKRVGQWPSRYCLVDKNTTRSYNYRRIEEFDVNGTQTWMRLVSGKLLRHLEEFFLINHLEIFYKDGLKSKIKGVLAEFHLN